MNKKGVSPLIATVLIIGFTVALAAVVITWGGRFIQGQIEDVDVSTQVGISCSKLNFEISNVDCHKTCSGTNVVCVDNTPCTAPATCDEYKIDSVGVVNEEITISNFYMRITESDDNVIVDQSPALSAGADTTLDAFESGTVAVGGGITQPTGNPKKVELIPIINVNGQPKVCSTVIVSKTDTDIYGVCA